MNPEARHLFKDLLAAAHNASEKVKVISHASQNNAKRPRTMK